MRYHRKHSISQPDNTAKVGQVEKLHHPHQDPARMDDIVLGIDSTLHSASKCVDTGYIQIYDTDKVNIYDAKTDTIIVSEKAILKGWRCPNSTLWRLPLNTPVKDLAMDTLLLNSPNGRQSKNSRYRIQYAPANYHIHEYVLNLRTKNPHPQ